MKMIMIEEGKLEALFDTVRAKLELGKFRALAEAASDSSNVPLSDVLGLISDLHRSFHYGVCTLEGDIKNG